MIGYSRDSFYRFKELDDQGGELALQEISRKKPVLKNVWRKRSRTLSLRSPSSNPPWPGSACQRTEEGGLDISPAGVRCVWLRHDLETMAKRLRHRKRRARRSVWS